MSAHRRHRGFEPVGRLPADQLGLPRGRGKELVLAASWRRVAGEAIARRAPALRIRRGVLEIGVDDERWIEPLKSLIPTLAVRLAHLRPELGVRKFRFCRADQERPDRAAPLPEGEDAGAVGEASGTASGVRRREDEAQPGEPAAARLESVIERYLRRSGRRGSSDPGRRP